MKFDTPATTNPTATNRTIETISGKDNTVQHASLHNQPVANTIARTEMGLPPGEGPIQPHEIALAKGMAAQGYDAVKQAGMLQMPPDFNLKLNQAVSANSKAAAVVPMLGDKKATTLIRQLGANKQIDAGTIMSVNQYIRDLKSEAFRSGKTEAGKTYGAISKVLEDAMQDGLTQKGPNAQGLLDGYKKSRQQFAKIGTVEDNLNAATGNIKAQALAAALKRGEPLSGGLKLVGQAAAQAPKAFAEPTNSAGVHHLGFYGALAGGGAALGHFLPENGHASTAAMAAGLGAALIPAVRTSARSYSLGFGQGNLLPQVRNPLTRSQLLGSYLGNAGLMRQDGTQ